VAVAELNVRDEPATSAERVATVDRGTVFVLDGYTSIVADGYTWWSASEVTNLVGGELPALPAGPETWTGQESYAGARGYIAVAKGAAAYVDVMPVRCPAVAELDDLLGMLPSELAGCFGSATITIDGTLTCGPCEWIGPPQTFEPRWLADESPAHLTIAHSGAHYGLQLHVPPEVAPNGIDELIEKQLELGSLLRVVGHVSDARSADCEITLYVDDDTTNRLDDFSAEMVCRQHFVVESYEVIGTDSDYDPPF
jgi:hypothetical protein